jgi:hypothetical protein
MSDVSRATMSAFDATEMGPIRLALAILAFGIFTVKAYFILKFLTEMIVQWLRGKTRRPPN